MELHVEEHTGRHTIHVKGDVDSSTSHELRDSLTRTTRRRASEIIVDLSNAPFISSAGLAVLIECLHQVRDYGGGLKLVGLSEDVKSVFALTRLLDLFDVYETLPEAVAASPSGRSADREKRGQASS